MQSVGADRDVTKTSFTRANEAAQILRSALPPELQTPHFAIVCGSGLGTLQHALAPEPRFEAPYESIPDFPPLTVLGHEGKMVFGFIEKGSVRVPVVLLVGRAHFYEGHEMDVVTFATRVCSRLGVRTMIVTNAAGGLNPHYTVGDIVMLKDHLNLAGLVGFHPLRGPNEDDFGVRFPPLSDAYDLVLRRHAHAAWQLLGLHDRSLREGVYAFVAGPSYETRAECRMLHAMGADLVGMSTVPEVIVARHARMKVLSFSLVTNNAVLDPGPCGDDPAIGMMSEQEMEEFLSRGKADHAEVLLAGEGAAETMKALVVQIIASIEGTK